MNKTEAVHHTKRASNRLKPVSDTCIQIINYPGWLDTEKQLNLLQKRLDRELTPEDTDGEDLREAFAAFHYFCVEEGFPTEKQVKNVYNAVRRVQSQRWRRLEDLEQLFWGDDVLRFDNI